ncbi:hypothetical protein D3C87_1444680 [compost metagenome]
MKGYEDVAAGIMLLVVTLVGGYFYLQSDVIKQQREELRTAPKKHVESKTFESLHKTTE